MFTAVAGLMSFPSLSNSIVRLTKNESGAVALLFALALVPLIAMGGAAIDYVRASQVRANLNGAMDAATLAVARAANDGLRKGASDWKTAAERGGEAFFAANVAQAKILQSAPQATFSVTLENGVISSTGQYAAAVSAPFMKLAGVESLTIGGRSNASISSPRYVDVHVVVDTSASMGIGATREDQIKMISALGCQFACHFNNVDGRRDDVGKARAAGARLRIDVIRASVAAALARLPTDGTARVAIYTFSNTLKTYFPLSTDVAAAARAAAAIELSGEAGQGGTNLKYSLEQLAGLINTAGDGLSSTKPKGLVVIGTDGTEDSVTQAASATPGLVRSATETNFTIHKPSLTMWGLMTVQSMLGSSCAVIKNKGYSVVTVQSKYVTSTDLNYDVFLDYIEKSLVNEINTNMTACASSPAEAFVANSPTEIEQAFASAIGTGFALRLK